MSNDTTTVFEVQELRKKETYEVLKSVFIALEERGYNPINQITGYLISGDLGYISSYKESRNKMAALDRSSVVEVLLESFLK